MPRAAGGARAVRVGELSAPATATYTEGQALDDVTTARRSIDRSIDRSLSRASCSRSCRPTTSPAARAARATRRRSRTTRMAAAAERAAAAARAAAEATRASAPSRTPRATTCRRRDIQPTARRPRSSARAHTRAHAASLRSSKRRHQQLAPCHPLQDARGASRVRETRHRCFAALRTRRVERDAGRANRSRLDRGCRLGFSRLPHHHRRLAFAFLLLHIITGGSPSPSCFSTSSPAARRRVCSLLSRSDDV